MHPSISIQRSLKRISSLLDSFSKAAQPETIHLLRVEIKKIRAWSSFLINTGVLTTFNDNILKRLFRECGRLREIQLHASFCQPIKGIKTLKHQLKMNKQNLTQNLGQRISFYKTGIKQFSKSIPPAISVPTKRDTKKYFKTQFNKCRKKIKTTDDAHLFRKRIKKLVFIYKFLPANDQQHISLDVEYFNKLQNIAGKWHDQSVAFRFFEKLKGFPLRELKHIKTEQQQQFDKLKQKHADLK